MELTKIHEDGRGVIYSLTGNPITLPEVSIISTKAGIARGGCVHTLSAETLVVIEGDIVYHYELNGEKLNKRMKKGDVITVPPNTPHYIISLTDSVIMEYGPDPKEKQEKHQAFRKIVEDFNNG